MKTQTKQHRTDKLYGAASVYLMEGISELRVNRNGNALRICEPCADFVRL